MKVAKFRKVTITLTWKGYGSYLLESEYKGKWIKTISHDSIMYDDVCESPYDIKEARGCTLKEATKLFNDARYYAYMAIRKEYENRLKYIGKQI